jgi:hypothetical protein
LFGQNTLWGQTVAGRQLAVVDQLAHLVDDLVECSAWTRWPKQFDIGPSYQVTTHRTDRSSRRLVQW